jgi:hypothetical protein
VEHQCYPLAVKLIAEGRVQVDGDTAIVKMPADVGAHIISPPKS